MRKFTFPIKT